MTDRAQLLIDFVRAFDAAFGGRALAVAERQRDAGGAAVRQRWQEVIDALLSARCDAATAR